MKYSIFLILLIMAFKINAQGFKEKSYHKMVSTLVSHSVNEKYAKDLEYDSSVVYLDAREVNEFNVSKIANAQWVGYDDFDMSRVENIDKNKEIIVYCTAGYRSEKVSEKLKANGFSNVTNMLGGLIEWANYSKPLLDSTESKTNKVHVFSRTWGIWLDTKKAEKVYD